MAESKPKMRPVDAHSGNASTTVQAASGCGSSSRSSADDILQLVGSKLRKEDALIGNFPIDSGDDILSRRKYGGGTQSQDPPFVKSESKSISLDNDDNSDVKPKQQQAIKMPSLARRSSNDSKSDRQSKYSKRKRSRPSSNAPNEQGDKKRKEKEALPFGVCVGVSQRFRKVCRVGEGTYGVVYKAEDREHPGDYVALKRCIPHHQASDGFPVTALREIQSLRLLHGHPHIISLRTDIHMVAVSKNDIFLVFEYCEHDLAQLLDYHYQKQRNPRAKGGLYAATAKHNPKSPFREANVKTLLQQLLSALDCMHDHRLIHRDIKVSNLLYTASGNLKLADFGLSRSLPAVKAEDGGYNMTPNVVSLWYRPPELLLGSKSYNQSIDIWGAGCVFAELLQGYPLWGCKTEADQIQTIFSDLGPPSAATWPSFADMPKIQQGTVSLAQQRGGKVKASSMPLLDSFSFLSTSGLMLLTHLLSYDANHQRLTAAQALKSGYFASEPLPTPPKAMPKFRRAY